MSRPKWTIKLIRVLLMQSKKKNMAGIAEEAGVSRQRVSYILARMRLDIVDGKVVSR